MRGLLVAIASLAAACGDNLLLKSDAAPSGSDAVSVLDSSADAPTDGSIDAPADAAACCNEGATSGTRLKLVWYVTPDGVKTLAPSAGYGYHDSQRDEDCSPQAWNDGHTYCSPGALPAVYADNACSIVLGQEQYSTTCITSVFPTLLPYIRVSDLSCGGGVTHYYQRGALVTPAHYYTKAADGTCSGPLTSSNTRYYMPGAEIDPSAFVEMTISAPEGTGTIQETWRQTADGLRAPYSGYDTALGIDCTPIASFAGEPICYPVAYQSTVFGDSACAVSELGARSCITPRFASLLDRSCAVPSVTFRAVGAQVASSPLYWMAGGTTCQTAGANPGNLYYALGASITPAPVQHTLDTTPGHRLEPYHFTSTDFSFRNAILHDATYDADCTLQLQWDGSIRCLPAPSRYPGIVDAYSDAACTTPRPIFTILQSAGPACPSYTPDRLAYRLQMGTGCPAVEAHVVGAAVTAPVYVKSGASCVQWIDDRFTFFDASTVVPSDQLGTATRVVDP